MKKGLAGAIALFFAIPLFIMFVATSSAQAANECGPGGTAGPVEGTSLDVEQRANAETIISTTRSTGLTPYAAVVAVATAMQESSLHNDLRQLDHDSIGLFQQRISIYGAQVAGDPVKSTLAFLTRLIQVPHWDTIPLTEAAQAVQRSQFPDAYAKWQPLARNLVDKLWPGAVTTCDGGTRSGQDGGGGVPPGYHLPTEAQQAAVVSFALGQLGKPYVWGGEGPNGYDCSGLVMAAWASAGVALPRTADRQSTAGAPVAGIADMQPGDLIFIPGSDGTAARPGHVGMYIGTGSDGQQYLVQAPHTGDVVKVSPVSGWVNEIVAIRRP